MYYVSLWSVRAIPTYLIYKLYDRSVWEERVRPQEREASLQRMSAHQREKLAKERVHERVFITALQKALQEKM